MSGVKPPDVKKPKASWKKISGVSVATGVVAFGFSFLWQAWALDLLLALYIFGAIAGWFARRHGWLCGIIVGLPLALFQLTRLALNDYAGPGELFADPDYWRLVIPASVAATGVAIMGGISGVWLQDIRWQREK